VCDNRTGLSWQQSPDTILRSQADALIHCPTVRPGYRLPSVQERVSVLDYTQFMPAITPGVFNNIQSLGYWSGTLFANDTSQA